MILKAILLATLISGAHMMCQKRKCQEKKLPLRLMSKTDYEYVYNHMLGSPEIWRNIPKIGCFICGVAEDENKSIWHFKTTYVTQDQTQKCYIDLNNDPHSYLNPPSECRPNKHGTKKCKFWP